MAVTFLTNEDKNLLDRDFIKLSQEVSSIKNELGMLTLKWNPGLINASGVITNGATEMNNYYSDLIKRTDFESILLLIKPAAIRQVTYCTYDDEENFIERKSWLLSSTTTTVTRSYEIDNSYNVRILICTYPDQAEAGKTAEEVLENITLNIQYKNSQTEITESKNSFGWLNRIDRNVHFSIDDVSQPLYDLMVNNPSSIYDNAFFSYLKQLHETYGICITCNTFNTNTSITGYDISNIPNTWATEFTEAKNWLKFAFHAKDDTSYAANLTSGMEDYQKFVNAVIYFTGSEDCIDKITRLGFFNGSLTEISKMQNSENGIIGLLCADQEDRSSYYLDNYANEKVQNTGLYYDEINNLYFIKSLYRLDSGDVNYIKNQLKGDSRKSKIVELFCHSTIENPNIGENTRARITSVLDLLITERGYGSNFIMDLIESWYEEISTEIGPSLKKEFAGKTLSVKGDSVVFGAGSNGHSWVDIISEKAYFEKVNKYGVSGMPICHVANRVSIAETYSTIENADYTIIAGGINDFNQSAEMGSFDDETNTTFKGALKIIIEGILNTNPKTNLCFITPHKVTSNYGDWDSVNDAGQTLKDYVNAIKEACEMYSLPCYDAYSNMGFNPLMNILKTTFQPDGTHPNTAGNQRYARKIISFLRNI